MRCLVLACLGFAPIAQARLPQQVLIVTSESSAPFLQAVQALRDDLAQALRADSTVVVRALQDLRDLDVEASSVVVALGSAASQRLYADAGKVPVIAALLPRAAYERIVVPGAEPRRFSGIFLDQPYARQLNLISLLMPERTRLLVLAGEASAPSMPALGTAATEHGFRLAIEVVADESSLYAAMKRGLPDADALLALPDAAVLNSKTARGVLVTAYHHQVPVIAFSPAYVKAGALASVSSTPAQIGQQAARTVRLVLAGRALPAPEYPSDFGVDINDTVARSLDVRVAEPHELRRRLLLMEGRP